MTDLIIAICLTGLYVALLVLLADIQERVRKIEKKLEDKTE